MDIYRRYIGLSLIKGMGSVLVILLAVVSFFGFVEQLDNIGNGSFGIADAIRYMLLTTPQRALVLAPIAALIGSLWSLAALAKSSELLVMRACGIGHTRLLKAAVFPAASIIVVLLVITQIVAPALQQRAEKYHLQATRPTSSGDLLAGKGFWSRNGQRFINVRRIISGRVPADIDLYEFSADGVLLDYMHAEHARVLLDGRWLLLEVERKVRQQDQLIYQRLPKYLWHPFWEHQPFLLKQMPMMSLSLTELFIYWRYLHATGQASGRAETLFWQKCFLPLLSGAMLLHATGYVIDNPRNKQFKWRLMYGAVIGVGVYLLSQVIFSFELGIMTPLLGVFLLSLLLVPVVKLCATEVPLFH